MNKKCKISHLGECLIKCRNVLPLPDCEISSTVLSEHALEKLLLEDLTEKDYSRVRIIIVDGNCVFDIMYPHIWQDWYTDITQSAMSKFMLTTCSEGSVHTNMTLQYLTISYLTPKI